MSIPLSAVREASAEQLEAAFNGPPEEAARWIAAAARAGMLEAQILYGQILLEGRGVAEDRHAALGWFQAAARAGSLKGLTMVGRCHELGWGTPVDRARATALYREAAEKGYDWAQYNHGTLLAQEGDRAGALAWYRRAAAQGHAKAMTVLGRFLEEGWETPRDPAAARALYARAAALGDFRAQFNLGTLATAAGDIPAALRWFEAAAAQGSPGFLGKMAMMLLARPEAELRALGLRIENSVKKGSF